ncbi:MAG: PIN domain nuclease [Microbacterium sp.]|uniref:type II toxin-antitoxin system VapC family toxin n=1 Tax=Microbacterium sp. TaxID=51671 RepID=UPI000DB2B2CC|nr:type II toxin-antitoxin system VapC family toxin [Microbacterium sp.]PZU41080.1 MAG: PIN domain nuclease [Microbacterium sp.]
MILLDTNAALWLYHDSRDLGALSRRRIGRATRVFYSAATVLEITIKHMLGRLPLPGGQDFPSVFESSGLVELPLTARHAVMLAAFPALARHDPFDRMLLAQARAEGLDLITSDATMLSLDEPWIIDARR